MWAEYRRAGGRFPRCEAQAGRVAASLHVRPVRASLALGRSTPWPHAGAAPHGSLPVMSHARSRPAPTLRGFRAERPPDEVTRARRAPDVVEDERGKVWLLRPRPTPAAFADIEADAAERMLRHGLGDWAFGFGRGKRTLGTTRVRSGATTGTIRISRHLVTDGTPEMVRDTLLHEIAHAVAYVRHGRAAMNHGPLWRAVAREIGARPEATCRAGPLVPAPHVLVCGRCGAEVGLYRRPKHPAAAYRHKGCGGRFSLSAGRDGRRTATQGSD